MTLLAGRSQDTVVKDSALKTDQDSAVVNRAQDTAVQCRVLGIFAENRALDTEVVNRVRDTGVEDKILGTSVKDRTLGTSVVGWIKDTVFEGSA